jgi:hypothetical protein
MLENLLHPTRINRPEALEAKLEQIARETGLIKRKSRKFSASGFLRCGINAVLTGKSSALQMARNLGGTEEQTLCRQALWDRMDKDSVRFMMRCVAMFASLRTVKVHKAAKCFARVVVEDSSQEKTSAKNHKDFPGHGNDKGKTAGCKTDFAFDLLTGDIVHQRLALSTEVDQKLGEDVVDLLRTNDLILRDMGYFCLRELNLVEELGAFWLSRLPAGTKACDMEGRSLETILNKAATKSFRTRVRIGTDGHEAWLIAVKATPEEAATKRRKRRAKARRNGRTVMKNALLRDDWHLIVTNIEPDMMSLRDLSMLYGIRWRIEIIFRAWKGSSHYGKALAIKSNAFHIQTLMFAGVLWLILVMKITTLLCHLNSRHILSIEKIADGLADYFSTLKSFTELFGYNPDIRHVSMEKRKKRKSLYQKGVCCLT